MANVLVERNSLSDIADSIRAKLGVQTTYKPSQMADAIDSISGGGITPTGTKQISITQNGTATEDVTNYASAEISVNVPTGSTPVINSLSVTENGTYTAPTGVDGYSPITVNVSGGGGSQQLTKLTEILISEDTRSIPITLDASWLAYDGLIFSYDLDFSASDWIYISATDLSGGGYSDVSMASYKYIGTAYKDGQDFYVIFPKFAVNQGMRLKVSSGGTFYAYLYSSSKKILTGSKIVIFGCNQTDL